MVQIKTEMWVQRKVRQTGPASVLTVLSAPTHAQGHSSPYWVLGTDRQSLHCLALALLFHLGWWNHRRETGGRRKVRSGI